MKQDWLKDWIVVVVEDEPDSREVAEILIMELGADVHTAANGQEGLELIRKLHPQLIISDLSMPEMDGWTMLQHLQQDRATMEIPIIALTAHAMIGDREKAIAAGFHNYLTKPLTPATFINDLLRVVADIPQTKAIDGNFSTTTQEVDR
jgi:CheY-like chemotaxis protein